MSDTLEKLQARLAELEEQIETEWAARRAVMRYHVERGRVVFEEGVREAHRRARVNLWLFLRRTRFLVVLTAPIIYSMAIPLFLLDVFVSAYQAICFPIYGIQKVKRADHVVIDRHMLAYLNGLQKLNCVYCGYANGVIAYAREIAARTEQYWCPIKHSRAVADPHALYPGFVDFGDAEAFRERSAGLRERLRPPPG